MGHCELFLGVGGGRAKVRPVSESGTRSQLAKLVQLGESVRGLS
jgi:hypothetical protein